MNEVINSLGRLLWTWVTWLLLGLIVSSPFVFLLWGKVDSIVQIAIVVVSVLAVAVISLFTRPLKKEEDFPPLVRFSYGFIFITIASLFLPIFLSDDKVGQGRGEFGVNAVLIMQGCETEPALLAAKTDSDGPRVLCSRIPPQWVFNVGGTVLDCRPDGECPNGLISADHQKTEEEMAARKERAVLSSRALAEADSLVVRRQKALSSSRDKLATALARAEERKNTISYSELMKEAEELRRSVAEKSQSLEAAENLQAVARLDFTQFGKYLTPVENLRGLLISGGLVVPLYFIVLAIAGAAVSMMRRVPEYQNRVTDAYKTEYEEAAQSGQNEMKAPISLGTARDYLIFQILQVFSAPLIALVAFSMVDPKSVAITASLGFTAGFASESVLLGIRAASDRLFKD